MKGRLSTLSILSLFVILCKLPNLITFSRPDPSVWTNRNRWDFWCVFGLWNWKFKVNDS